MESGNLWGDLEGLDLQITTPKEILEAQAKFLPKLTKDLLYAEIKELESSELYNTFEYVLDDEEEDSDDGFAYKFLLKSRFMDTYRFELFRLHHNIGIYPVRVHLDSELKKELYIATSFKVINNEKDFIEFLRKVLQSQRVRRVIGALMKLSK